MAYRYETLNTIFVGRQGDNILPVIRIDVSSLHKQWQDCAICLNVQRPGETTLKQVAFTIDNMIVWEVLAEDVYLVGTGKAQIVVRRGENELWHSKIYATTIEPSLNGEMVDPPEPERPWYVRILDAAAKILLTKRDLDEAVDSASDSADRAETAASNASTSAQNTETSKNTAKTYADNAKSDADRASASASSAEASKNAAKSEADKSFTSAQNAANAATSANTAMQSAKTSADNAATSASNADASKKAAAASANTATTKAGEAEASANKAKATLTELENKVASGDFHGKDGYTPVKGKDYFDGKDGKTPEVGKDYFTESDKTAIVNQVKDAVQPSVSQLNNQIADQGERITTLEQNGSKDNEIIGDDPADDNEWQAVIAQLADSIPHLSKIANLVAALPEDEVCMDIVVQLQHINDNLSKIVEVAF